jgi:hypothetical protein
VFVIGLLIAGLITIEWTVLAWSERATATPLSTGRSGTGSCTRSRSRRRCPRHPHPGRLGVADPARDVEARVGRDRPSALPCSCSVLGFVIAYRPRLSRDAIAGILIVCVLGVIGAGIFAAANGSREFEHHESDHAELAPEGTESGG